MTSFAPKNFKTAFSSFSLNEPSSSLFKTKSPVPKSPLFPFVAVQTKISDPSFEYFDIVPPQEDVSSSG